MAKGDPVGGAGEKVGGAGRPSAVRGWRQQVGSHGEAQARAFLEGRGYQVVTTNYRCPWGEVDIIAWDGPTLVFVEVKTRRSKTFGSAVEAVTAAKARRLADTAQHYLAQHSQDVPWRIDVVAIHTSSASGGPPQLKLVQNAVTGD